MGNWKIGTLGLASLVAFTSLAAADTPATAEKAAAPSANDVFAKLPSGKLEMPKSITMPKSIGATEKVEGFFVELPPYHSKGMHGPSYATVHASSDAAQGFRSGNRPDDPTAPCFMSAYPSYSSDVNWSSNLATTTNIQNYSNASYPGAPNYGSVNLVRSDRVLKEEKDKLTYEVKVVFADAETMGVRQHSKQTLDFTLLRELPGKVKVWGAKSDGEAIFLVRREKHEKERFFHQPITVTTNGMHVMSSSEACPVVFTVKTGKNIATSAVIQVEALLEITEPEKESAGEGFISALPRSSPAMGGFGQREAKLRPMRIGISSSWMSQDTQPVVSLAHGWAGKERTQPI
ncbi:MAG: hypothetical protein IPM79_28335 [Polyangiaceae bacterium]|jgi:hypothetical protein|nr:hypothetical protein [Polyangiaceae bacterium]MBK8941408.1 hypothetical protein [Polyangiaceae bacterium]